MGLDFSGQPLIFICADPCSVDLWIFFITELLVVEVFVNLEVLTAGEAVVKNLVRFIRAPVDPASSDSVNVSVPRIHTPHILTSASKSVTQPSPVVGVFDACHICPQFAVLA